MNGLRLPCEHDRYEAHSSPGPGILGEECAGGRSATIEDLPPLTSKQIADIDLIPELVRRGRLNIERRTVDVPDGLESWIKYSTGWLVDDEVVVSSGVTAEET